RTSTPPSSPSRPAGTSRNPARLEPERLPLLTRGEGRGEGATDLPAQLLDVRTDERQHLRGVQPLPLDELAELLERPRLALRDDLDLAGVGVGELVAAVGHGLLWDREKGRGAGRASPAGIPRPRHALAVRLGVEVVGHLEHDVGQLHALAPPP